MPTSPSPIRPLTFGGLTLENNLFQAPLAGYSAMPFRLLAWLWGRPGLLATEMISANALAQNAATQEPYLVKSPDEGPVQFQLWGADPERMAVAARIVTERGADVVDLNCGCPVRKVRAAGAGSKLMEDPALVGRLVRAIRQNTHRPVSVKIRVGPDKRCFNAVDVARAAEAEGADLVTVHGRHAGEAYGTPCRYAEIRKVVEAVRLPVVGNGDVRDGLTARRMFAEAGVAGAMVGRACMGAPWSFARIRTEAEGKVFTPPTLADIGAAFLRHHDWLAACVGEARAVRICRKLGSFYSRGIAGARDFRDALHRQSDRAGLAALVATHFAGADGAAGLP